MTDAKTMLELAERIREFTAMKYMGNCKCGKCQLIPKAFIEELYAALCAAAPSVPAEVRERIRAIVKLSISDGEYIGRYQNHMTPSAVINLRTGTAAKCREAVDAILAALPPQPPAAEPVAWEDIAAQLFAVDGNGFWEDRTPLQEEAYTIRAKAVALLYASPPTAQTALTDDLGA